MKSQGMIFDTVTERSNLNMKIKKVLFSEKGMKVINALFFLSVVFYGSGFIFIAYAAWIVYLSFCIKNSESKGSKTVFSVFIGFASVMICLNLYFLIRG